MPEWESFDQFLREAMAAPLDARQAMVETLLEDRDGFPWVRGSRATFVYAKPGAKQVALNLDTIKGDPPFVPMERLEGTHLFYVTYPFERDDLLDYLIVVDDPMTPLAHSIPQQLAERVRQHWRTDPYNATVMKTATADVSVLRMPAARPFPDWSHMAGVPKGSTIEHRIDSETLGVSGRKVWVHTPPNYRESGLVYPLLVLQDGQWAMGPLQVPFIADALVKHGYMAPVILVMVQSGSQQDRLRDYVMNDSYYAFVMNELLPFLQSQYRIDATNLGIGGASAGGIAAAAAALKNPAAFNALIMLSPPLGKGLAQDKLSGYMGRFEEARLLPRRIFHSVGRYETIGRFLRPNHALYDTISARTDTDYKFVELGSGHGLVAFRSAIPEALAWAFPGWASL